ncbi:MAG: hypothetical protein XD72_1887 [Methanothrix harundinacea]|jgi:hypothetical protein|uniref:Uncharacterized protein n=1 Tax=Methanothrix harundinacea TaxID=301375 RepID=A0A117MBQ5_9EURY|nr:MAG: hypothetical protein XD72_1887 [Methanothrix harundinacea]KUK95260.1 MAG: hypothetical protein XE07_1872 [Methanothrix harundinacea]
MHIEYRFSLALCKLDYIEIRAHFLQMVTETYLIIKNLYYSVSGAAFIPNCIMITAMVFDDNAFYLRR